ncbi:MAG: hypothetical protein ACPG1A_01075 [Halioglobus sp.]
MLKLIYLAQRKPGFSFDEFVCRWRQHGALGMSLPLWRFALGYVQAEPIKPSPFAAASDEYDAVCCYMVQDEMFSSMTEADLPGAAAMAADELETFSGPIPDVALWVSEETLRPGPLGGFTSYLFYTDTDKALAMARQVRDADSLSRVILNRRDDNACGPDANTLPYSAVLELSANTLSGLGVGTDERLADADVAVITREAVLWDRLP